MFKFQCKKCKRKTEHCLKVQYPCDHCGGRLRYLYDPIQSKPTSSIDLNAPLSTTFIPVRCFGGLGDIWYYRRKPRKKLKLLL